MLALNLGIDRCCCRWRAWTRQRRMKAARQRAALAVYERRLLGAALRQWRWVQHSKCLLRRVFGTAVELWQEEVRSLQFTVCMPGWMWASVLSLVPAQPLLPGAHQVCHSAEHAFIN